MAIAGISTNTNLVSFSRGGKKRKMTELIPLYASGGWKNFDLNFCEMMNPDSVLNTDGASEYIEELKLLRDTLGLSYVLSHAPYPRNSESSEESTSGILKSMEYAEELGVPTIVIHPIKGGIEANIRYFSDILERHGGNINIAIENMESEGEIRDSEGLITICKSLYSKAGVCLDTGHLHMSGGSIPDFVMKADKYLIATHIADNDGKSDQHLLPGFGTINWEEAIRSLNDYYGGFLNYECMYFSSNLPETLSEEVIALSLKIMDWLTSLCGICTCP